MVNGPEDVTLTWGAVGWRHHEDNVRRLRQRIFTGLLELLAVKAARAVLRGRRAQQCARRYPTCDVMSHVMSGHVDWRSVSEDVIRSSVRGAVPVLACVVGNCGVRSPG
jgi:hypothetical protein